MASREPVALDGSILWIRSRRVMLAADLAKIYGVETRVLNQAVKRNRERFPDDFTFRLTRDEAVAVAASRSQSVILKRGENIKYLPYAFTEHGAIMSANTLNSPHAVRMSVYVVRAFIRLRATVELQQEVKLKLDELERAVTAHDTSIKTLFAAVRQLMTPPEPKKRKIGFLVEERAARYGKR
jgi:ORF6N domain